MPQKKERFGSKRRYAPCQKKLRYQITWNTTNQGPQFVDLAGGLSAVNRALYRQGHYYEIASVQLAIKGSAEVTLEDDDLLVVVSTIPDTWMSRSSYRKSKKVWDYMNRQALKSGAVGSQIEGHWADYKLYMNEGHKDQVDGGLVYLPTDQAGNAVTQDDWVYSKFVLPDSGATPDTAFMFMLGATDGSYPTVDAFGCIDEWFKGRPQVQPGPELPSTIDDSLYAYIQDVGDQLDDIIEDLMEDNDNPPYNVDACVGAGEAHGPWVAKQFHIDELGYPKGGDTVGGFTAPLGLLAFQLSGVAFDAPLDAFTCEVVINLRSGEYKGVKAHEI